MATTFPSTKLFLKTARFGSRHRKKKSTESSEGISPVDRRPSAASAWSRAEEYGNNADVDWAVSSPDRTGSVRKFNSEGNMRETIGLPSRFQGLPPSLTLDSCSFMEEDDELEALQIITRGANAINNNSNSSSHWRRSAADLQSAEEGELDDVFEMEVPIHIVRDKRPGLQVSIPKVNIPHPKSSRPMNSAATAPTPQSAISTASSMKSSRPLRSGTTTGTPLSIVSPLSVVEMPKPQRPFSTESIEGMAKEGKASVPDTGKLMSMDNAVDYEKRSRGRGRRSPATAFESASEVAVQETAYTMQPTLVDATALRAESIELYHAALVSTPSTKVRKGSASSHHTPAPMRYMRRQASSTSLATTSTININKPLPPEPGRPAASPLKHIAYTSDYARSGSDSQAPSRSNSTSTPQKRSNQLGRADATSPTSLKAANVSRKSSRTSLRSKFTPKDLDAMDDAFQRRPSFTNHEPQPLVYSNRSTPSQSQVSLVLDPKQLLHTIAENSPRASDASSMRNEPLQISRGPMRMEPTRRPPQPPQAPQRVHTIAVERIGRGKRPPGVDRTATNHQRRPQVRIEEPPQRTSSAIDSMSKAERILGKTGLPASSARPDLRPSFEFTWNPSGSTKDYMTTESPASQSDGDEVSELDARRDTQEMEIRGRLALLSAKDDPSTVFEAFHKDNVNAPAEKRYEKVIGRFEEKPTIEEKLHLTGSLRNEVNVPTHIAELEAANRTPSPAELEGSFLPPMDELAELGPSSSVTLGAMAIPPEPAEVPQRRGRFASTNPHSTASGNPRSRHSRRSVRVRSFASLAASDIPDIYASLPTPSDGSVRPSMSGEEIDELVTADAAERVLLHILQSLDSLEDLFAASMVSKGFYKTFKRHELYLLKRAIWRMSPAAWELREVSIPYSELPPGAAGYTPHLYFRHYVQDLLTMVELKAMILESCKSFLRQDTIQGLAGETERSPMIDEAFWRVWTFCRIFGCGNSREDDIVGQMDWLKGGMLAKQSSDTRTLALTDELARNSVLFNPPSGFARGNGKGLGSGELFDMYEIWTCLGVLVRGYHGKRQEAREYGVYDSCDVSAGDTARENVFLEEWTHHLLTLAPSTVLDVTSPATPTRTQFAQARSQGYTSWAPPKQGASRSTFLKEAVSRVYEEKLALERSSPYSSPKLSSNLPKAASPSIGAEAALASRERIARHAAEIRKKKEDPNFKDVPVSDDRPLSNYSDVLDRLEAISTATGDAPPMPKLPGLAARLSRHKSKGNSSLAESTSVKPESPAPGISSLVTSSSPPVCATVVPPSTLDLPSSPSPFGVPAARSATTAEATREEKKAKASKPLIGANSPARHGAGRFSSLRGHITPKRLEKKGLEKKSKLQTSVPSSPAQAPDEKFPVHADTIPNGPIPSGPQVRDPVDLAVEKLVGMGFQESRAKKALAQTESGNGINFESALQRLKKEKERMLRLERLQTMG